MGSFTIFHWLIVIFLIGTITFDWRRTYDWYLISRFIDRVGFHRKRVRCFASRFSSRKTMTLKAQRIDINHLQWAYRLSDHRQRAKRVIFDELLSRGVTEVDIEAWVPPKSDLTVPLPKPIVMSLPAYLRAMTRRRRAFKVIRFAAFTLLLFIPFEIIERVTQRIPDLSPEMWTAGFISSLGLLLSILVAAIAALVTYSTRAHNIRILLLRPFGQRRLSSALRRVVLRRFGFFGNVLTLSDRNYRPSIILEGIARYADFAFIVFGPIFRRSPRGGRVKNERMFLNLARMLHKASYRITGILSSAIRRAISKAETSGGSSALT